MGDEGGITTTELDRLRRTIDELSAKVEALEEAAAGHGAPGPSPTTDRSSVRFATAGSPEDRRRALKRLAGVAAAAGGGLLLVGKDAKPAAGANGQSVTLGSASNTATLPTGISVDIPAGPTIYGLGVTDRGLASFFNTAAIAGHTNGRFNAGVYGYAQAGATESPTGVLGESDQGTGVHGWGATYGCFGFGGQSGVYGNSPVNGLRGESFGTNGRGLFVGASGAGGVGALINSSQGIGTATSGGRAALRLETSAPDAPPPTRTDSHLRGEVDIDANGDVWLCTSAGTPGVWRKIAGPNGAGAFHALATPVRVYDSRPGQQPTTGPKTPLQASTPRAVSLSSNNSGVPAGATAVLVNLVATGTTTGIGGYLSVYRNGITFPGTSNLNWSAAGQTVAVTTVTAVDANASCALYAGSVTDVVVDVLGYYR
jgi:hypothetical protein